MKKANIIVKGEVQRVGYIDAVAKLARKLKIDGFVENLKHYFEIKRGDWHEELLERLDTADTLLYKSVELGEKTVALGERSVALGEESVGIGEKMLEKQDKTIDAIDQSKAEMVTQISSLRDDLRSYMEYKFAKIKHEVEAIKAKIGMI
ncbi:hypothetical protein C4E24_03790 [ANME-1 cluster archaeon AG-394-G21]|nr:hypothetical protein [ANME-1 cluster archaeon AG-394-G21]